MNTPTERDVMARLSADFDRLFPEMRKPDPIAEVEAVEGVCAMEDSDANP